MTGYFLGIDGGGTGVRALLTGADGDALGTGAGGPCNIAAVPVQDALAHAWSASRAVLGSLAPAVVRGVCAGVAGASVEGSRLAFLRGLQELFPNAYVEVVPDYVVAHAGAFGAETGVLVIAGTGSIAYGENAHGETHRTGGYGHLLDDSGSGYGVGRAALNAVLRAWDSTGERTTLTVRVLSALHLESVTDIVPAVYGGPVDRVQIASLSRVVFDAAQDDNDPIASHILMRAGGSLAVLAHGVTQRLFPSGPFGLSMTGSLWNAGPALTDVFTRSVRRFAPDVQMVPPAQSPVQGAAARARRGHGQ